MTFARTPHVPVVEDSAFRAALARFASGVTIVTTIDEGGREHGFTASSFCSVSLRPPLVLVCLSLAARSYPAFATCDRFAVSILGQEQADVARRFGRPEPDKFDTERVVRTPHGLPVIDAALATIECLSRGDHAAGDHMILLGEVVRARTGNGGPTVYYQGAFHGLAPPPVPPVSTGAPGAPVPTGAPGPTGSADATGTDASAGGAG